MDGQEQIKEAHLEETTNNKHKARITTQTKQK